MPPRPCILSARGFCHQQTPRVPHTWAIYRVTLLPFARVSRTSPITPRTRSSPFHSSTQVNAEITNHYETLGLTPEANGAEIKKQFYHLSKIHHPDHNPDDPHASTRFQSISNAYSILGKPTKRQAYDRSLGLGGSGDGGSGGGSGPAGAPAGSYSSAQRTSTPFGARPASGLNKRRGTFRGPPPSFYASGGWGAHSTKRRAAQSSGASATAGAGAGAGAGARAGATGQSAGTGDAAGESAHHATSGSTNGSRASSSSGGGTHYAGGVGGGTGGMPGEDVPHFDRQRHFERQEEMDERMATRRRARREQEQREHEAMQRDLGFKVIVVSACVVGVWLFDVIFVKPGRGQRALENKKDKR